LIITRFGAHRSTSSTGQASPATTNAADSKPAADNTPTAEGVWFKTVTCSRISKACKSSGDAATSSGTTTSRPPCNNAPKISYTDTSNTSECHCDHTRTGPTGNRLSTAATNAVTPRCETATPLGIPVVPEV